MEKIISILFVCFSVLYANAQIDSVVQVQEGYGVIDIQQDARIPALVETHIAINKANNGKFSGWRIQIYSSSGTTSRAEAQSVRKAFLTKYPDVNAYLIYQPPFFKIRVGDFRTKSEAYSFYKQILPEYPISYLLTDQVNYPKLKENVEVSTTTDLDKILEDIH